jgi:hypothetical protein
MSTVPDSPVFGIMILHTELPKATTEKVFFKNLGDGTAGQWIGPSSSRYV